MTRDPNVIDTEAEQLFSDWIRPSTTDRGPWLVACVLEPGPISLRARWHYLRTLAVGSTLRESHQVTREEWQREIELESAGDAALIGQQLAVAHERFGQLLESATHPVVRVQALIGLGDAFRQDDQIESAREKYEAAARIAADVGFQFGAMRAQLPLAYIVRRGGSAEQMLEIAERCEQSARSLGDDIYVANSQVAQGEALDLLGRPREAVNVLTKALDLFSTLDNAVGIAGAGVRLADVHRRQEDADAVLAVLPKILAATRRTGAVQEMVDLYDLFAFAHIKNGQYDRAIEACDEGIRLSGTSYPRAMAHLRMSKGTALRKAGHPDQAIDPLLAAFAYFDERDTDGSTVSSCLSLLASCAEQLDAIGEAVELRLRAIESLEVVRAGQSKPRWQSEMRRRFDDVYRGALECAVRANQPAAFAAVFESLWGRRLIGIASGVKLDPEQDPVLLAQLLALNDRARRNGPPCDPNPELRRNRSLGQLAIAASLPDQYDEATASTFAAAYRPLQREEALVLLDDLDPDVALLLICEVPARPGTIAWLSRRPGETPELGQTCLAADATTVLDTWALSWPRRGVIDDVAPLRELLPAPIRELPLGCRLQIVALDRLWGVPWAALPVSDEILGMRHSVMLSPSLSLLAQGQIRQTSALPPDSRVVSAIGPDVRQQNLAGLRASSRPPSDSGAVAHRAIRSGSADAVVVVAHGRPTPGIGHYLELGSSILLTPTEMLEATPPPVLALLCCWGARTTVLSTGEPLTLATVALARGARQVLTSVSELGDSVLASTVVNDVLYEAREHPWATAVSRTLSRHSRELRSEPLINWATLTTLGAW